MVIGCVTRFKHVDKKSFSQLLSQCQWGRRDGHCASLRMRFIVRILIQGTVKSELFLTRDRVWKNKGSKYGTFWGFTPSILTIFAIMYFRFGYGRWKLGPLFCIGYCHNRQCNYSITVSLCCFTAGWCRGSIFLSVEHSVLKWVRRLVYRCICHRRYH